ncbi:MAG: type IX secretion system membrane protein PorP/SprF [Marinilabiliales bacterium]|nr:type IX secretion system membrane protein PorP/SprF [Marinilabiliales bacterium]
MKFKGLLLIFLNILTLAAEAQQDPQVSQHMFNQLMINPGFAGDNGPISLSLLNRQQWMGFPGAPVTTVFQTDAALPLIGKNDGMGFTVLKDAIGYEKNVSFGVDYAYRFTWGKGLLGCGVSLGLMNKNLRPGWSESQGGDLIDGSDPSLPKEEVNGVLTDVGLGFFYRRPDYYLSLSATHVNQPKFTFDEKGYYSLKRHYYLSGGYTITMNDDRFLVLPSFLVKSDGITSQLDLDMLLQYNKRFWGGLGYRNQDAIMVFLGFEMQNGLKIGYSYDMNTSALSRYNTGSHELYVSYSVRLNKNRSLKTKSVRFL